MNVERLRPVVGGISSGSSRDGSTGTLGAQVFDKATGSKLILSNAHVYASKGSKAGDIITQPGSVDGGIESEDKIAQLLRWITLDTKHEFNADAAVAQPDSENLVTGTIKDIGTIAGVADPELDMHVYKSGRTTQLTSGIISDISATFIVEYPFGVVQLTDLIVFEGNEEVVKYGDSGSLLVTYIDQKPYAVGLVFAGPSEPPYDMGIACKIKNVMQMLSVTILEEQIYPVQLKGQVTDTVTMAPIPNVHVFSAATGTYTDLQGNYNLGFDQPGTYVISVAAKGYYGGKFEIELFEGENVFSLSLAPYEGLSAQAFVPLLIGMMAGSITLIGTIAGD